MAHSLMSDSDGNVPMEPIDMANMTATELAKMNARAKEKFSQIPALTSFSSKKKLRVVHLNNTILYR